MTASMPRPMRSYSAMSFRPDDVAVEGDGLIAVGDDEPGVVKLLDHGLPPVSQNGR